MRKDVTDLKQFVLEMVARGGVSTESIASNPNLFANVSGPAGLPKEERKVDVPAVFPTEIATENEDDDDDTPYEKILDISHETEEESLLLEQQEKEMILKALKKNHNRRKNAARDLGISERTLYRKIKLFGIEE